MNIGKKDFGYRRTNCDTWYAPKTTSVYRLTNGTAYIAQMFQQLMNIYILVRLPLLWQGRESPLREKTADISPKQPVMTQPSVISSECTRG